MRGKFAREQGSKRSVANDGAPKWLRPAAAVWAVVLLVGFIAAALDLFVFHHFKDDPSLCVATATGVLAAVTVLVVADARDESAVAQEELRQITLQAQAAQAQVEAVKAATEASNRAFQASYRPLIADVPFDPEASSEVLTPRHDLVFARVNATEVFVFGSDAAMVVSIPLRNAGTGVAIVTSSGVTASSVAGGIMAHTAAIVNPGNRFRITCLIPADRTDWAQLRKLIDAGSPAIASVGYLDQAGDAWRTDAHLHRVGGMWYVRQIAFCRFDEATPLFMTGPADVRGVPDHIR